MPRNVLLCDENDVVFACKNCGKITPNNSALLENFCCLDCKDEYNNPFDGERDDEEEEDDY